MYKRGLTRKIKSCRIEITTIIVELKCKLQCNLYTLHVLDIVFKRELCKHVTIIIAANNNTSIDALEAWTFDDGQPEEAAAYLSDCQQVQLFFGAFWTCKC